MRIYFSPKAEASLLDLSEYLKKEFSEQTLDKFLIKLDNKLKLISNLPFSSPKSLIISQLYKCVVTKQITLYYRIDTNRNEIEIITLFDSRQNPSSILDD